MKSWISPPPSRERRDFVNNDGALAFIDGNIVTKSLLFAATVRWYQRLCRRIFQIGVRILNTVDERFELSNLAVWVLLIFVETRAYRWRLCSHFSF